MNVFFLFISIFFSLSSLGSVKLGNCTEHLGWGRRGAGGLAPPSSRLGCGEPSGKPARRGCGASWTLKVHQPEGQPGPRPLGVPPAPMTRAPGSGALLGHVPESEVMPKQQASGPPGGQAGAWFPHVPARDVGSARQLPRAPLLLGAPLVCGPPFLGLLSPGCGAVGPGFVCP